VKDPADEFLARHQSQAGIAVRNISTEFIFRLNNIKDYA
jgi:hypothetical protein